MRSQPCPTRRTLLAAAAAMLASPVLAPLQAQAQAQTQTPSFALTARDQKFEPAELEVPAGQKFELRITNAEAVSIEFESSDLRREKVITRGQSATLYLGPLKPGRYEFFDDFRRQVRGVLIAR
jgi:hypothetical protein